jgi:hypothetical protein
MLDLLSTSYTVSPSRLRFLKAALTNPVALNIRNRLAHGVTDCGDLASAALLIHIALSVTMLRPLPKPNDATQANNNPSPKDADPTP